MSFAADIRHWPTVAQFEAYLAAQRAPSWAEGVTLHHTISPAIEQWRGRRSLDGLLRYYRDEVPWTDAQGRARRGWSAGPHLFVGPDGIWQLTPLARPGIHAVSFNSTHWGVEVVGSYDKIAWQAPIRSLVFGATAALLRWRSLTAAAVNGHRDDPETRKSCPGWAINLDAVRRELATMLAPAAPVAYTVDSPILGSTSVPAAVLGRRVADAMLRQATPRYARVEVEHIIIPAYVDLCERVGVDPFVAVGQMCHETAWLSSTWCARPRRNPAGIGVTGEPGAGVSFASWADDAIPAHVGRLLAYALPAGHGTAAQQAIIARALRYRDLPLAYRGMAPTLRSLAGTWATDPDYAGKVAGVARTLGGAQV